MDLDSLLLFKGGDWAYFGRHNTNIGNHPEYPISVFYNPRIENVVRNLLDVLGLYIMKGFELRPDDNHKVEIIDIYINGTPNFNERGQVRVE